MKLWFILFYRDISVTPTLYTSLFPLPLPPCTFAIAWGMRVRMDGFSSFLYKSLVF